MANPTNPNGANQYQLDPRQEATIAYYIDPKSETFGNLLKSALKAGYKESYAISMYSKAEWLPEKGRDMLMLEKAENNLNEFLTMSTSQLRVVGDEAIEVIDPQLAKIKQDTTKFVAERLGKNKYSTRNELTGKDGKELQPVLVKFIKDANDRNTD